MPLLSLLSGLSRPRGLFALWLCAALLAGQAAAQRHAFEHVLHETEIAECAHDEAGRVDGIAEVHTGSCLLVHALDSVLAQITLPAAGAQRLRATEVSLPTSLYPPRLGLAQSRAPPAFS